MADEGKSWFTTRKIFSLLGLTLATTALWAGKLDGENWVFALAVIIAGHHAADIVKAAKGEK